MTEQTADWHLLATELGIRSESDEEPDTDETLPIQTEQAEKAEKVLKAEKDPAFGMGASNFLSPMG